MNSQEMSERVERLLSKYMFLVMIIHESTFQQYIGLINCYCDESANSPGNEFQRAFESRFLVSRNEAQYA